MKWILIVLALNAESEAILAPRDAVRTGMANALRSLYIERELLKDVHDGVTFDSKSECRAAIERIESRAPEAEAMPHSENYKRICKAVRREGWL